LQPGDIDFLVEFHSDDHRWDELVIEGLSYGKDSHRVLRAAMVGRKRGVQFLFNARRRVDFDLTLWRRGDDLATALARLRAIAADPSAGRAERHAMLPQFQGLDHRMSRSAREYLIQGIDKRVRSRIPGRARSAVPRAPIAAFAASALGSPSARSDLGSRHDPYRGRRPCPRTRGPC